MRGETPEEHKGEGRAAKVEAAIYGVRLANAEAKAATPSRSARTRKFTKMTSS